MKKTIVPVKGMHCRSCELILEDSIKEIKGVKEVHANTKDKQIVVLSETSLNKTAVIKAINDSGYEVGKEERSFVSKNTEDYKDLLTAGMFLFALYLLASTFGLDKLTGSSNSDNSNLFVVLTIGLTAGFSTCMALVGGLILGISARHAEKHPEATPVQKFRPHLFFNLGRVLSYFFLGGLIGQLGSVFKLSGPTLGVITIAVGLIMLYLGTGLIEIFPSLSSGPTLPKFISNIFKIKGRENKEYSHKNALVLGALTFFLPCGFTQAMQVLAISTGSFVQGALIMSIFALGTTPGLLGIGGLTSYIKKGRFAKLFFKFVGLLVIALSLFNISNGLNLTGVKAYFGKNEASDIVKTENGVQIVNMDQVINGYKPNKFTVKVGIPVRWVINSKDIASCASSLVVPKLGISKTLSQGENIIEFTPKETGKITFTCAMGMYSGYFNVIGENESSNSDQGSDTPTVQIKPKSTTGPVSADTQVLKAIYDTKKYIQPNNFTVKAGKPVRLEIAAKEDGVGCMSSVMIPGLDNNAQYMEKGQTAVFEFTPEKSGEFQITCAMGVPFGSLTVN